MFIIIWSRWGFVVVLLALLGLTVGWTLAALLHVRGIPQVILLGVGLVVGAAFQAIFNRFVVGTYLDKPRPVLAYHPVHDDNGAIVGHTSTAVVDPDTGEPVMSEPVSTFFFLPLRYWPAVLAGLGLLVVVINMIVATVIWF